MTNTPTATLYMQTVHGLLMGVGISATAPDGWDVRALTDAEATLYVAGGCPALAAHLGLRLPEPV